MQLWTAGQRPQLLAGALGLMLALNLGLAARPARAAEAERQRLAGLVETVSETPTLVRALGGPAPASNPSSTAPPVGGASAVAYIQDGELSKSIGLPTYEWYPAGSSPRAVILAIHGLAMHGRAYSRLAKTLAGQGYAVVATDLRGYGRYAHQDNHEFCDPGDCRQKVDYNRSFEDISRLARALKVKYPGLPTIVLGESLGGAMAIRLAAQHPDLVNALVLSAPAIKRHSVLDPSFLTSASVSLVNPRVQLDLMPFMHRYSSDDPEIINELIADPMVRKHLSVYDLLQTSNTVRKTITYVDRISPETPVLVIQGGADRIIRANGVMLLLSRLHSQDQTVKWFTHRGHILLETAYVKPDTMEAVVGWINHHVNASDLEARRSMFRESIAAESNCSGTQIVQPMPFRFQEVSE